MKYEVLIVKSKW